LIYVDYTYDFSGDLLAFWNNLAVKLGSIEFYPFGRLGKPLDKQNGLYSDVGYKGHYGEVLYYTIEDGTVASELAIEYNNQPNVSPKKPGTNYDFGNFGELDYFRASELNISQVILTN